MPLSHAYPSPFPQGCATTAASWQNFSIPTQTSLSTVTYDDTSNASRIDGATGLAGGAATAYTNLAVIVRFNTTGTMDVWNGSAYGADATLPYAPNTPYHVRFVVDLTTRIPTEQM